MHLIHTFVIFLDSLNKFAQLFRLPRVTITQADVDQVTQCNCIHSEAYDQGENCSVCLEDFEVGNENIIKLNCAHLVTFRAKFV